MIEHQTSFHHDKGQGNRKSQANRCCVNLQVSFWSCYLAVNLIIYLVSASKESRKKRFKKWMNPKAGLCEGSKSSVYVAQMLKTTIQFCHYLLWSFDLAIHFMLFYLSVRPVLISMLSTILPLHHSSPQVSLYCSLYSSVLSTFGNLSFSLFSSWLCRGDSHQSELSRCISASRVINN